MKILIVSDKSWFTKVVDQTINTFFPKDEIIVFCSSRHAIDAIATNNSDFDILILNDELCCFGHGWDVLNTLTKEQIEKTIIATCEDDFMEYAKEKGVSVFIHNQCYEGICESKSEYILGKIKVVLEKK